MATYIVLSVENFYWILFENLLKPAGLDCFYYFPWGTQHNISSLEYKPMESRRQFNHVFFHFDQEPLWSDQLGPYDKTQQAWSNKFAKFLANSEHSSLKAQICKSRKFLDWYFFYHGFAALDWYSDAQYITDQHAVKNAFLSLNHACDGREYRAALLARLLQRDVVHKGSISFHGTVENIHRELSNPNTRLGQTSKALLAQNVHHLSDLPWKVDDVPVNGDLSARFGHGEYKLWQNSLWHIVNETVFYEPKLHLTEKAFRPIVAQRPFILVAAPGNLAYLRRYGFKTFDNWVDESYDSIQDPEQRLDAIADEIIRLSSLSLPRLKALHRDMLPVLEYNKQHFFGAFRKNIVSELVDNFVQGLRIWNNGRVDDRELILSQDPELIKRILLR